MRIDAFLAAQEKGLTRSRIQSLIREGHIKVNKLTPKSSYKLRTGDSIRLFIPQAVPYALKPEKVDFSLVYEDSSLMVINKPPGLVIHPAPGHSNGTLVHGLLQHCRNLSGIGGVIRPGIVHRLDKDTSGLMVVAKNDYVHGYLSKQFKEGKVKKRYLTLVHGIMKGKSGKIDLPIARHPRRRKEMAVVPVSGKRALTLWEKREEIGNILTLLDVKLKTGRTHQIRVHLSHIGHPIVGDKVYGYGAAWWRDYCRKAMDVVPQIKRQMLHSGYLGFIHPDSKSYCEFSAVLPEDMNDIIMELKRILSE